MSKEEMWLGGAKPTLEELEKENKKMIGGEGGYAGNAKERRGEEMEVGEEEWRGEGGGEGEEGEEGGVEKDSRDSDFNEKEERIFKGFKKFVQKFNISSYMLFFQHSKFRFVMSPILWWFSHFTTEKWET